MNITAVIMLIMVLAPGTNAQKDRGSSVSSLSFSSYTTCIQSLPPVLSSLEDFYGKAHSPDWSGIKNLDYTSVVTENSIVAVSGFVPNNYVVYNNIKIEVRCIKVEE